MNAREEAAFALDGAADSSNPEHRQADALTGIGWALVRLGDLIEVLATPPRYVTGLDPETTTFVGKETE